MFSGLIPGLNSVHSPENEIPGQIPASLITLLGLPNQFLSLIPNNVTDLSLFTHAITSFRRERSADGVGVPLPLALWFGVVITIVLIAWSHSWKEEEEEGKGGDVVPPLGGKSPGSDAAAAAAVSGAKHFSNDALIGTNGDEIIRESDEKFAEELQVQEALFASLLSSRISHNAMSPPIQTGPTLKSEPSHSFCGICFEDKETWEMFVNESCSHSFCYDCTSKHIVAKIQYNVCMISCPGVDCKAPLDFDTCRQIIPNDVLVLWDESLCKSLIPESQTVYCPFRDCLAMLVNDSGEVVKEIECPSCHRIICAECRVPWHLEFTCEEYQRLNAKKKRGDDALVKELAKKKSWRKCPHCKTYVEKIEGCLHITCRCAYEFCYQCGSKWTKFHGGCRQRP